MRVLIVSGIWPPDVGGPASHAPEVAEFLRGRGHRVEVVTTAEGEPAPQAYRIRFASRRLPPGARHAAAVALVARAARGADVVYTTGMFARSAAGALVARRPYVVKLTGDPAFERARWRGTVAGDVETFQRGGGGAQGAALRTLRDVVLRHAAFVFCPSAYLRELAIRWGVPPDRVEVLPNPAPLAPPAAAHDSTRNGTVLAFAGRLTPQKSLEVALEAVAGADGVTLRIAGDGPEEERLRRRSSELGLGDRVEFLGVQSRERVLELFRDADAAILSSSWENFPHTVVEALAVGTPVIATDVGGVAEVVQHERNGLLVPSGDAAALRAAIERFAGDAELRGRLRGAAVESVADYAPERLFARLEAALEQAAAR